MEPNRRMIALKCRPELVEAAPCSFCGEETTHVGKGGWGYYRDEGDAPVCYDCTLTYAPELVSGLFAMLGTHRANHDTPEEPPGDVWTPGHLEPTVVWASTELSSMMEQSAYPIERMQKIQIYLSLAMLSRLSGKVRQSFKATSSEDFFSQLDAMANASRSTPSPFPELNKEPGDNTP